VGKRPAGFQTFDTFHPTFLYESLWCLLVALLLLWISKKRVLQHGGIFLLYVATYSFGRFWIEQLRIDESEEIFGLRFNIWVSLLLCVAATIATIDRRERNRGRARYGD
jgi:prolipoprotein diacylglyceryltransferase